MNQPIEDRLAGSAAKPSERSVVISADLWSRISRLQGAIDFAAVAATDMDGGMRKSGILGSIAALFSILADEGSAICEEIDQAYGGVQ
jgi:hypothetical protein